MDFTMAILFIHGAGGFTEDRAIADAMGSALGLAVDMPEFSDTNMSFEAWADPVRRLVGQLSSEDIVVAHSFGASILLRVLAEGIPFRPERAFLLAMPDWSPEGWDVEEYAFFGPEPDTSLSLHHCRDDEVVPFEHLALSRRVLPSARFVEHPTGGHQFVGAISAIASDILDDNGHRE